MDITKVDDNTIKVVKTDSRIIENNFTYEYLVSQKKAIQEQKDRDNIQRDAELAEIDEMLAQCKILNVSEKPKEEIV